MTSRSAAKGASIWAGLTLAPLAWAAAVQLGLILPYRDCASHGHGTVIAACVGAVVALLGGLLSWKARDAMASSDAGRPRRFVGSMVGLGSLVFGFALILQIAATLVLSACER